MRWAAILAAILAIPTGNESENMAGRHVYNVDGWNDAQMIFTQSTLPGSGYPGLAAFPSGSGTKAYYFDKSSDECVEGSIQLSHYYEPGSNLSCHIHWSPINTDTTSVTWQLTYTIAGIGETFGASTTIYSTDAADGVAYKHQMADFADIECATCTISSMLIALVCRDADGTGGTDDYNNDAVGISFDCHEHQNSIGSSEELAK